MDKKYIARKIENCEKLVENAISPEQKEIYQGYLDHWKSFDKSKKSDPGPAKKKSEETQYVDEKDYEAIFEFENAPKQAYYKRNGQWVKTKAFKEYLNKITQ